MSITIPSNNPTVGIAVDETSYLAMLDSQNKTNTTPDRDNLSRVRIERENIENEDGDIIMPAGCFSIDDPTGDGRIYAKQLSFRHFGHFYRYKRYDAHAQRMTKDGESVMGAYIHSVLVNMHTDEAPSDDGGFQCGRPLGYITDWKSLPENEQEFIKSCRQMVVFFGEFEIEGVDYQGRPVIDTIPAQMELSNKTSGKTLGNHIRELREKKRINPNSIHITLKTKKVKGGVTYYDLATSVNDSKKFIYDEPAIALAERFNDYIQTTNKFVMERHRKKIDEREDDTHDGFLNVDSDD